MGGRGLGYGGNDGRLKQLQSEMVDCSGITLRRRAKILFASCSDVSFFQSFIQLSNCISQFFPAWTLVGWNIPSISFPIHMVSHFHESKTSSSAATLDWLTFSCVPLALHFPGLSSWWFMIPLIVGYVHGWLGKAWVLRREQKIKHW